VVDATIIHAPSSTKSKGGKRDPEMHQTKKGNQYFFGVKAHIGVDAESGLVHSLVVKNTARLVTLFALSNLWMARRHLLSNAGEVRLQCGE
jgi:IS5 family transposase